jgi:predicted transcriptional regulator
MNLTLELPPHLQGLLQERAALEGRDEEAVALAILRDALDPEVDADLAEGIQRGLDDFAAGRFRPFAEFAAEQRRKYHLPDHE